VLTRLEIDGFKNLLNFSIDFGPFNCIAGPNGVGKSNIFDAIHFLSLLASNTLTDAALKVREETGEYGDIRDIFYAGKGERRDRLRIAAEMIIPAFEVSDDFGRLAKPSSTFLRYEIQIGYESGVEPPRLTLQHESLDHIKAAAAASRLRFPHKREFTHSVITNRPRKTSYISTTVSLGGDAEIRVHQDGRPGLTQAASAKETEWTIVGVSNNAVTPTVLAAKREMQRWQVLALEPSALRQPDRLQGGRDFQMASNGAHLPATLQRMWLASVLGGKRGKPDRLYGEVVSRISRLIPVRDIRVDEDKVRNLRTLEIRERDGPWLRASSLSDGTLRFLALSILAQDPGASLVCMEEPENGLHPRKIENILSLLAEMATDADFPVGPDNPLRQVIVVTHSPVLVQEVHARNKDDLLFAVETAVRGKGGQTERTLRCLPLHGTWRDQGETGSSVGLGLILDYLTPPSDAGTTHGRFAIQ
jgi:predicted ATPase